MPFTCLLVVYILGAVQLKLYGILMWPFTSYNKTKNHFVTKTSRYFEKIFEHKKTCRMTAGLINKLS